MNENVKQEILSLMKKDILRNIENINATELIQLSSNLFTLCLLKAQCVDNQTIINELMNRNALFLNSMQTKGAKISTENYNVEIELYTKLKNKYIKIIKSYI